MRDVKIKAGSETYTFRFSTNAICSFEEATGEAITTALSPEGMRFATLRQLVHAGLSDNHEGLSLKDVGDIMDEVGFDTLTDKLTEAITKAFPESAEGNVGKGDAPTG